MQTVTLGQLRQAVKTVDKKTDHGKAIVNTVDAHAGYGDETKLPVHDKIAEACQTNPSNTTSQLNVNEQPSGEITPGESGTFESV